MNATEALKLAEDNKKKEIESIEKDILKAAKNGETEITRTIKISTTYEYLISNFFVITEIEGNRCNISWKNPNR